MLITKLQNAATLLQIYAKNPILCNTLIFRAEKDTPFQRRKLPRSIPGGFGTVFPRRRLHFFIPGGLGGHFLRGKLPRSIPGGLSSKIPRRSHPAVTIAHKKTQQGQNPAALKIQIVAAYLQTIISRIILSVVCIPSAPMRPRLQMVFSIQSSIIPSFEEMQMLSIARTAA